MKVLEKNIDDVLPYANNPRNNDEAVPLVANSIKEFGWKQPIVIDKDGVIIAGHTRWQAAQELGLKKVPCVIADDLTDEQVKAYRLADNKTAERAAWDFEALDAELDDIGDIDMSDFGFDMLEEVDEDKTAPESIDYHETVSVVIECADDEEAETIYDKLTEEGYKCRVSTL